MSKYHFIGMCGKAMGTLAVMLQSQGNTVTGSDEGFYDPMLSYLKDHNISFITGHKSENIPSDVDYIVIGKHAKLTPESNPEVAHAFTMPGKIKSLPEIINRLTELKGGNKNIVCVGSFGKSSVTTLTSFILEHAGKNPSYFIGAVPLDLKDSGKLTKSNIFGSSEIKESKLKNCYVNRSVTCYNSYVFGEIGVFSGEMDGGVFRQGRITKFARFNDNVKVIEMEKI
jgi:UDP-N-acetylmuramate: L-alanyl-gamma-D-glutamyl-meso-diaminopimelate ligase